MAIRKIRIALIEDSQTVRFFYKSLFEKAGFEVFEAENARKGWDIICDQKPDIIVLDMMMPEIPGLELLKRIRTVEFSKDIPVIVMTSVKETEQVQEIFKSGASHYSLKGMDSPEMVKEVVYKLLKERQEKIIARKIDGQLPPEDNQKVEEIDRLFWWF